MNKRIEATNESESENMRFFSLLSTFLRCPSVFISLTLLLYSVSLCGKCVCSCELAVCARVRRNISVCLFLHFSQCFISASLWAHRHYLIYYYRLESYRKAHQHTHTNQILMWCCVDFIVPVFCGVIYMYTNYHMNSVAVRSNVKSKLHANFK